MDTAILDLLADIGRTSVARLNPAVTLTAETATARREQVLRTIRGTVLPRRLEFTAANGDCLAIEVNSSRVTDVFRVRSGLVPDFETEARENLAEKLAQLVSDIAAAPGPMVLISLQPDIALEADDVGITFREISDACHSIELPAEPVVSIVPDHEEDDLTDTSDGLASQFYAGTERFAQGRVQINKSDGEAIQADGTCTPEQPMYADSDLLKQFAADLAGWDKDTSAELELPQLIVLRPSGGKGTALAVLHDGSQISAAVHEARKLGAVVSLWKTLTEADA
ncbi:MULTISPECIES: hypothetical protein [unclassified Ruegeria]|uniref:hypothetical protein n=1 Tax=unclassified Ruegeria TaxID=2625375 RepID=UPI0014887428|nr:MULTISPECIES: hypothetical protein [unclassified Ruegeria]